MNPLTELEVDEIAAAIKNGNTSGKTTDEENISVCWDLKYEKWAEDEEG